MAIYWSLTAPWPLSGFIWKKTVHQYSTKCFETTWIDDDRIFLFRSVSVVWHLAPRFKTSIWVICCQLIEAHQWQSEQRELPAIWTENFPLGEWYIPSFVSQSSHLRVSFNMFPPSKEPQLKQQMGMRYFPPGYACHLSDRILFDIKVSVQFYWETMQIYKCDHTF